MYIAMGGERAEQPPAPRARPARPAGRRSSSARSRRSTSRRRPSSSRTASGSPTTSSSSRPARGSCPRRSSTSTPRRTTSTRAEAALELRQALDAFSGGRIVDRRSPACPTSARRRRSRSPFLIEAELRERGLREQERAPLLLADRARVHDRERVRDGDADPRGEGDRAPHVLQRRGDRRRAPGRPEPRGRGAPVRPAHPRAAAQGPAVPDRLRASRRRPAAGCRPTARPSRSAAGRTSSPSATRPTCRSRRRARPPTSRRRS